MIVKSDYFFLTIAVYILLCSVCRKRTAMHLKDFVCVTLCNISRPVDFLQYLLLF